MQLVAKAAVAVVGAIHVYILVLEAFLWNTPFGRKAFRLDADFASKSATLAKNQGLYNGFLAAGLFYALVPTPHGFAFGVFFLVCVIVAGIVGAVTASRRILLVQALPAAIALAAWLAARP